MGAVAFDACGGAVNRVHPQATAYVHRDALFLAQYSTNWGTGASAAAVSRQQAWLDSVHAAMRPYVSGQAYQNYIDPALPGWRPASPAPTTRGWPASRRPTTQIRCSASRRGSRQLGNRSGQGQCRTKALITNRAGPVRLMSQKCRRNRYRIQAHLPLPQADQEPAIRRSPRRRGRPPATLIRPVLHTPHPC